MTHGHTANQELIKSRLGRKFVVTSEYLNSTSIETNDLEIQSLNDP